MKAGHAPKDFWESAGAYDRFIGRMLGLDLEKCNPLAFSPAFDHCILNHASFQKAKLKGVVFKSTELREALFTECDLRKAVFDKCDLDRAAFNRAYLEEFDFRTAFNYNIDPEVNRLKKDPFFSTGSSRFAE